MALIITSLAAGPAAASEILDLIGQIKSQYAQNTSPAPVIGDVAYLTEPVKAYAKLEIRFDLQATYTNPFDPDDIAVEGHFVGPDGREIIVPAFYLDRFEPVNGNTANTYLASYYRKTNESGWRVRFSSGQPGDYSFYITARDAKGQVTRTQPHAFRVVPSESKGFVRVAKDNPRYFQNSGDGTLFYGTGANVFAVIGGENDPAKGSYEYYFAKAKGNATSTRVWICHWRWLEWTPNPGNADTYNYGGICFYNQAMSSTLDRIFDLAEESGLRVQLTLEDNQELFQNTLYDGWTFNPYNSANGGPVATPEEYWASAEVRRQYKKRLRYIAARWGYSTSLWSLNQWNDMNSPSPDQVDYSKDLHGYAHTLFDGWRPIIFGSNFGREVDEHMDYAMFGKSRVADRPAVTQECYYTTNNEWFRSELQDQLWEGLLLGNAARMVWPHWKVDRTDAWPVFASTLRFVSDVPLHKKAWRPMKVNVSSPGGEERFHRVIEVRGYGDIPNSGVKAPQDLFFVDNTESNQFLEGYAAGSGWQGHVLYGQGKASLRNPPTFVINVPESGEMLVRVKVVGAGRHRLTSVVNGEAGPSLAWDFEKSTEIQARSKAEQFLTIPLKQGENRVSLDCDGPQNIRIGWVYFLLDTGRADGPLTASGMISEDNEEALVYLKNQTYSELYHTILEKDPAVLKGIALEVPGLKDGKYQVGLYDPSEGRYIDQRQAASVNGRLTLAVPAVEKGLALRIRPVGGQGQ